MTREDAIAIIRKEYLCVNRDCDIERSCGKCDLVMPSKEPILEAYKAAIKALKQEPKTGHWIKRPNGFQCSKCLIVHSRTSIFCPSCGAKMVEPRKSEEQT